MQLLNAENFRHKLQGIETDLITLKNKNGMTLQVSNYGARIVSWFAPDRQGNRADIILGYDSLEAYLEDPYYMGALIGRFANRINRGKFSLFGKTYQLTKNVGRDHLHGGIFGFHAKVWIMEQLAENEVQLSVGSPDGEEGYPGSVSIEVRYRLREDNALHISFIARSDQATIINLTSHPYFNLTGDPGSSILDHRFKIEADHFTPINQKMLPTGEVLEVQGTVFDFRKFRALSETIEKDDEQLTFAAGYDHNFVLKRVNNKIVKAATVIEPRSGRQLEVFTSEPGLQLYSGNSLKETAGKFGSKFAYRTGFCLEAQHFPDSPNHPHFPMTILMPDQIYRQDTIYKLSVLNKNDEE